MQSTHISRFVHLCTVFNQVLEVSISHRFRSSHGLFFDTSGFVEKDETPQIIGCLYMFALLHIYRNSAEPRVLQNDGCTATVHLRFSHQTGRILCCWILPTPKSWCLFGTVIALCHPPWLSLSIISWVSKQGLPRQQGPDYPEGLTLLLSLVLCQQVVLGCSLWCGSLGGLCGRCLNSL